MSVLGRTAFVTGASRGIGREIALAFGRDGANVACVSTTESGSASVAAAINAEGGKAIALRCDISKADEVEAAVARTIEELGSFDILVNNAGVTRDQLIMRMTEDDWDTVLSVNLKGAFNCIKAASKAMMKARYGRIVNITSIVGLSGQAGQANYAASKAGLIGLTKSVAKEFGSRGITCNAVAPGFIETEMTQNLPEEMRETVVKAAPLGRLGSPCDVASAVLFLCGEGAGYVTGQVLVVDGGLTL